MKLSVICLLLLIICIPTLLSQTKINTSDGYLYGKVIDADSKQPIEYVSVGVFAAKDSSVVSGVITINDGSFKIASLPFGKYYIDIKFLGYKKMRIKGVILSSTKSCINMGEIVLEPAHALLQEVLINGVKDHTEFKLDKKVVNVAGQLNTAGGTAVDVLENTPSVQTDVEGNVQVRGSSNFTVLVDGKPTTLKGSEALQQIPAGTIQTIEIITNPSAKYDPEGSAGIINVLLKKEKKNGLTGMINGFVGTGDKYGSDAILNYKTDKVAFSFGIDYSNQKRKMEGSSFSRRYPTSDTLYQTIQNTGSWNRENYSAKFGLEYNINEKNMISLTSNISQYNRTRITSVQGHEFYPLNDSSYYYTRENNFNSIEANIVVNTDYLHRFNDNGHQLWASINIRKGLKPEEDPAWNVQNTTDKNWKQISDTNFLNELMDQKYHVFLWKAKVDYTLPFSEKSKLEAGYQSNAEVSDGELFVKNLNQQTNTFETNPLLTNRLDFLDHVEAIYTTYSNTLPLFDYQLGIRGEFTDRKVNQEITGEKHTTQKFDFFPTVHLSRQLPHKFQVMASYSRRVNRPNGMNLDPYIIYFDKKNLRQGNPALQNEYTHSYEFSLQKRISEAFISVECFLRHTNNLITQINKLTNNNVNISTFDNLNRDQSLGTEISLNLPLTKWFTVNAFTSAYHYELKGSLYDSTQVSKSNNNWNSRLNTTFRFKTGLQIQANLMYNAASITAQGSREAFYFSSIGIKQDFFKKKLSVTLQARDILGGMKYSYTSKGVNFDGNGYNRRESRIFILSFSYKINNFKQNRKSNDEGQSIESDFNGGI